MKKFDDRDLDPRTSAELRRVYGEARGRHEVVGPVRKLVASVAIGAIFGLIGGRVAQAHGNPAVPWSLLALGGAALGAVAYPCIYALDRIRDFRARVGKPPLGTGALLGLAIGGAILVIVIVVVMTVLVLS